MVCFFFGRRMIQWVGSGVFSVPPRPPLFPPSCEARPPTHADGASPDALAEHSRCWGCPQDGLGRGCQVATLPPPPCDPSGSGTFRARRGHRPPPQVQAWPRARVDYRRVVVLFCGWQDSLPTTPCLAWGQFFRRAGPDSCTLRPWLAGVNCTTADSHIHSGVLDNHSLRLYLSGQGRHPRDGLPGTGRGRANDAVGRDRPCACHWAQRLCAVRG